MCSMTETRQKRELPRPRESEQVLSCLLLDVSKRSSRDPVGSSAIPPRLTVTLIAQERSNKVLFTTHFERAESVKVASIL